MRVEYIILHTAASGKAGVEWDVSAAEIDAWHRGRGWACIGYHYLVRLTGAVQTGRREWRQGAHCLGYNSRSVGICFAGHGDFHAWDGPQRRAGMLLVMDVAMRHQVPACRVLGHRETGANKSCPGVMVNMDEVRADLELMGLPPDNWPSSAA